LLHFSRNLQSKS